MEEVCCSIGDYIEKYILFGYILWVYLGQPRKFTVDPRISKLFCLITKKKNVNFRSFFL